jgi:phage baseplate assembly protein W|tara:strand:+ start:131 stop:562 length:432 start_codon:yes stop_codon:yes gene_type:complete
MAYVSDKRGEVSITSSKVSRYSDLNLQMIPHPLKKDIIPLKDDAAVKNAVRNLLLTNFFERPFNSTMGANLRGLLFEPNDAITRLAMEDGIRNVLEQHEPRIENINILVETTANENEYRVVVVFSIKEDDSVQDIEINLRRLR